MKAYKLEHPEKGFKADAQTGTFWSKSGRIWSRINGPVGVITSALQRFRRLKGSVYPEVLDADIVIYELVEVERVPVEEFLLNREWKKTGKPRPEELDARED